MQSYLLDLAVEILKMILESTVYIHSLKESLHVRLVSSELPNRSAWIISRRLYWADQDSFEEYFNELLCEAIASTDIIHHGRGYIPSAIAVRRLFLMTVPRPYYTNLLAGYIDLVVQEFGTFDRSVQASSSEQHAARHKICQLLVDSHGGRRALDMLNDVYFNNNFTRTHLVNPSQSTITCAVALGLTNAVKAYYSQCERSAFSTGILPSPAAYSAIRGDPEIIDFLLAREDTLKVWICARP